MSFKEQKVFILMMLITFPFMDYFFLVVAKISLPTPTVSSQSFMVFRSYSKSTFHFELIFGYSMGIVCGSASSLSM